MHQPASRACGGPDQATPAAVPTCWGAARRAGTDASDTGGLHTPLAPPNDFTVIADHPPTPQDVAHLGTYQTDKEGGDVLYQFRVGDFALTPRYDVDSAGPAPRRCFSICAIAFGLRPSAVPMAR